MRFTIRDLLWLTLVVGLALGWWAERRNTHRRIEVIRAWAGIVGADAYPKELFEDLPPAEYEGRVKFIRTK